MVLRSRFGMTFQQAEHEPAWYVDMLLAHDNAERQANAAEAAKLAELERTEQQFLQDMKAAGLDPDASTH